MSGPGAIRGFTFQHAAAVHAALDALVDPDVASVRFEGSEDIVDVEALKADESVAWARQMKTRQEPGTWSRGDLLTVLGRWAALPVADSADFEFVGDAQLGPSGVKVVQLLAEASAGGAEARVRLAEVLGVPNFDRAGQIRVHTRAGTATTLLEGAELRVLRLLPRRSATPEEAAARVAAIFQRISILSGELEPSARIMTVNEVAAELGIDRSQLLGAGGTEASKVAYCAAVMSEAADPSTVGRDLIRTKSVPSALTPVLGPSQTNGSDDLVPLSRMLESRNVLLVGPSGSGKSTAATQLRRAAAEGARVAIVVSGSSYLPWRLDLAVGDEMELRGPRIDRRAIEDLLTSRDTVLILDGISELRQASQEALQGELLELRRHGMGCSVIATGRDVDRVRSIVMSEDVPDAFSLAPLTTSDRFAIARGRAMETGEQINDAGLRHLVRTLEEHLGPDAGDPLVFGMAISVAIGEHALPETRADLYQAMLDGFSARNRIMDPELLYGALGIGFSQLIGDGVRSADRFLWLQLLSDAAERVRAADPSKMLQDSIEGGLLVRPAPAAALGPVHDSVADFLAAWAVHRGLAPLAGLSERETEEVVAFLCDLRGIDQELALNLARENPWLAVRLSPRDRRGWSDDLPQLATDVLLELVSGTEDEGVTGVAAALVGEQLAVIVGHEPGHVPWETVEAAVGIRPVFAMDLPTSPLAVAARAWGGLLRQRYPQHRSDPQAKPYDIASAVTAIAEHEQAVQRHLDGLIGTLVAPRSAERLREELGPTGILAIVGPEEDAGGLVGRYLPVAYSRPGDEVIVIDHNDPGAGEARSRELRGHTTLDAMLSTPPEVEAWNQVTRAINRIVRQAWL